MGNVLEGAGYKFLVSLNNGEPMITRHYSLQEIMDANDFTEQVLEDFWDCDCTFSESLNHCECVPDIEIIKPFLKFPDNDSEGKGCWNGDLLVDNRYYDKKNNIFFLWYNGYKWISSHVPKEEDHHIASNKLPNKERMLLKTRLCHIYDKQALDLLGQRMVDKLKEKVR